MIHIAIATMGNQDNINTLCSELFWQSIHGKADSVYILSQVKPIEMSLRWGLFLKYSKQPLGCGGARQVMVDGYLATGLQADDVIVFLDDDIEIMHPDWLPKLIAPLAGDYSISGVEGRKLGAYMPYPQCNEPDYVSGGWCAIRGDVFLDGCRFDDRYFPNYWEDVDLCYQARAKGKRIACVGNVGLRHAEKLPTAINALLENNRAKFYAKWNLE
jgi:GT2 family glycosyltransferase